MDNFEKVGKIVIENLNLEKDILKTLADGGFQTCLIRGSSCEKHFIIMRKDNE